MFKSFAHKLLLWLERQEILYFRDKMHIGKRVRIKRGLRVKNAVNITLGNDVSIGRNVIMEAQAPISIGDCTLIASGVTIVTAIHNMPERNVSASPVKIGNNCWLGAGAIILPGVVIGDDVTVGAGSVVTKNLPAGMIYVGVPARPLKPHPES